VRSRLTKYTAGVSSLAFSPAEPRVATANAGTITMYDPRTGRQLGPPLKGSAGPVYALAFSPDGKVLAAGNGDDTVTLWDVQTGLPMGAPLRGHSDHVVTWHSVRTDGPWPPEATTGPSSCGT